MSTMRPEAQVGISKVTLEDSKDTHGDWSQSMGWDKAQEKIKGQIMENILYHFKELCFI